MPRTKRQRPPSRASVTVQVCGERATKRPGGGAGREPVDDLGERAAAGDEDALEVEHLDLLGDAGCGRRSARRSRGGRRRRARRGPGRSRPAASVRSTCGGRGAALGAREAVQRREVAADVAADLAQLAAAADVGERARRPASSASEPTPPVELADRAEPGERAALAQDLRRVGPRGEQLAELRRASARC